MCYLNAGCCISKLGEALIRPFYAYRMSHPICADELDKAIDSALVTLQNDPKICSLQFLLRSLT